MIRPEALEALTRWRGFLIAGAVAALGLWWMMTGGDMGRILGGALVILGGLLAWTAWQRRRFATGVDGPGAVEVIEGQISYFGPAGGGYASLSEISHISIATRGADRAWVIATPGEGDLVIPIGAAGSEALFDAFGSLPGLTAGALIAAVEGGVPAGNVLPLRRGGRPTARTIWTRPPPALR